MTITFCVNFFFVVLTHRIVRSLVSVDTEREEFIRVRSEVTSVCGKGGEGGEWERKETDAAAAVFLCSSDFFLLLLLVPSLFFLCLFLFLVSFCKCLSAM